MGFFKKVFKAVKRTLNPVKAIKDTFTDPLGQLTVGLYSPVAKQKAAEASAKQKAEAERAKTEQRNRQSEARREETMGDSQANSAQIMLADQATMLNSMPTLLTSAEGDEAMQGKLGRGNRLKR